MSLTITKLLRSGDAFSPHVWAAGGKVGARIGVVAPTDHRLNELAISSFEPGALARLAAALLAAEAEADELRRSLGLPTSDTTGAAA